MRSSRAQIEVQFNWIFILIVGALILALFFAIVNTQKKSSDQKLAFALSGELEKIFSGASAIGGTTKSLDLLKFEIETDCDNIFVGGRNAAIPITHRPVFAPKLISGPSLVLWSQDWNTPFRTTTFLYATSPAVRYVFVKSTALSQKIFNDIPSQITKEIVDGKADLADIQEKGNYKIRIILFDDQQGSSTITNINFPNLQTDDADITLLNVRQSTQEVLFFEKDGNVFRYKGKSIFTDSATLYGAIFSEDFETYNCLMNTKALPKLRAVSQIYSNRTDSLAKYYETEASICQGYFFSALPYLQDIERFSRSNYPTADVGVFQSSQSALADTNRRALSDSCQTIY